MTSIARTAGSVPALTLIDSALGGEARPVVFEDGALPGIQDVRLTIEEFRDNVGGGFVGDYVCTGDEYEGFRWNGTGKSHRTTVVLSPATIGTTVRNLLSERRAADRLAEAKENGVDPSPLAATWFRKYDTTVYNDEQGKFQFYEVTDRDAIGRPVEIIDTLTGEVFNKLTSTNKVAINDWSLRSRCNMAIRMNQLDTSTFAKWALKPALRKKSVKQADGTRVLVQPEGPRNAFTLGQLGMVTLTLPGDWVKIAPTGRAFKRLVGNLRKKWERDIGEWRCLWKLEFQERGAPHLHILIFIPPMVKGEDFRAWLSDAWTNTCEIKDDEERRKHRLAGTAVDFKASRMTNGNAIVGYFLGHSSKTSDGKEYQHIVPEEWQAPGAGPGRFWGYTGLEIAVVTMEIEPEHKPVLERELRKLLKARDWKAAVRKEAREAKKEKRDMKPVHEIKSKVRRMHGLGRGGSQRGGTVIVKNALPVARSYGLWIKEMNTRYTSV
jgi:hypothetical protein